MSNTETHEELRAIYALMGELLEKIKQEPDSVHPIAELPCSLPSRLPWKSFGVILPHGTPLRCSHNKYPFIEGEVRDGLLCFGDRKYDSPSGAIMGEIWQATGRRISHNGWKYWQAKLPGSDEWVSIYALRLKAQGYL